MSNSAIMGSLVDVKNVNTHKSVRLTIDIPAEQAVTVIEIFGWPTMVDPVPVAIARLNDQGVGASGLREKLVQSLAHERKRFQELPAPQQAGMMCNDPVFWAWIRERHTCPIQNADDAANWLRDNCGVSSRAFLSTKNVSWLSLLSRFQAWRAAENA